MSDPIKRLFRKIKRVPLKPPAPAEPLWKVYQARREGQEYAGEFWVRDKERVRDLNFQKMLLAREDWLKQKEQERQRLEEIAEQRLKNLAKARRKLKRIREVENGN